MNTTQRKTSSQGIRFAGLTLFALAILLSACVPNLVIRPNTPDVVVVANTSPTVTNPASTINADNHFVQLDDYFIMDTPLEGNSWVYASMAKMTQAPSIATDNQAQFMRIMDGQTVWTKNYVRTRKATRADLTLGKPVVFLDLTDQFGNYRSPESNQEARVSWWLHSRIVDLTELFKGLVMVGDGLKVNESALRVIAE